MKQPDFILEAAEVSNPYDFSQENMDLAYNTAVLAGFEVIIGDEKTLTLDLDNGMSDLRGELLQKLRYILEGEPLNVEQWCSKSGKGIHAIIRLKEGSFTEAEAIALECALGSDPLRAALAIIRLKAGITRPRMLFKPATSSPLP